MQRLSLLTLFLFTAYFAICSLIYTSRNPTIGWGIVIATSVLLAAITTRAYHRKDAFGLGFSAVACLWLSVCLGFVIETPRYTKEPVNPRTPILKIMKLGRPSRKVKLEDYATFKRVVIHDLYASQEQFRIPDEFGVPDNRNALRLVACWSALIAGVIGGAVVSYRTKHKRLKTNLTNDASEKKPGEARALLSRNSFLIALFYFVFCALNYISENATLGWLFVIATTALLAGSLISSFRTRNSFKLGFAVLGSLWLSTTLGFALETPVGAKTYDIRTPIWNALSFGRGSPPEIEDYTTRRESHQYSWYESMGRVRLPNFLEIPEIGNTLRLAACWSALGVGVLGGVCFTALTRVRKSNRSTE